jgi:polyisoprenoid-binding protein YceI
MIAALWLATALAAEAPRPELVYRVDPAGAEAGFDVKATAHTVHGKTTGVSGEVHVVDEAGGEKALSGRIEIAAGSLDTANARRDQTMKTKCLAVDRFPAIVFAPARFVPSGARPASGAVPGALTGMLTIRDVTKAVVMTATLEPKGTHILVAGTFDVPWLDFGIPDPSFFIVSLDKVAHAHFKAEFVPAGP